MLKFLSFLFLSGCFLQAIAQAPDPDFNDKVAYAESQGFFKKASFREAAGYSSYDLIYQRLNFQIDPAINYISGSVLSEVKFLIDHPIELNFDLNSIFIIDSVLFDHKKINFNHHSNIITLNLPNGISKNSLHHSEVFYKGAPPLSGLGAFTASKHNNVPVIYTLSEPYGARDWWPCKESLSDKIDSLDVYITCPEKYRSASNGKLISDQIVAGKRTSHWKHRFPIATYLVAMAVTNYETYSDWMDLPGGGKLEILNYIYPEYVATAKSKRSETIDIMNFYNNKFITYPFASEKYGHAQFGWSGGMEHQTMSFMADLEFGLVAHEMAHQWFGDYITLGSWHDIWLNEGFATYLTGLVYENLLNGVYWSDWKKYQISRITSLPGGSVYVADTTDINRIFSGRLSYSKGSYLLHMLRWELGDAAFFKVMKNYLTDPSVANGFATQKKLVEHFEAVADTSLTEFFNDWYYGEGYPVLSLVYFNDQFNPSIQKLRISQVPSHSSVKFFEMKVPIRIWKNGKYTDLRLQLNQQNQEFIVSDQPFDKIEFDPDQWLIAKVDRITGFIEEESKRFEIQFYANKYNSLIGIVIPDYTGNEFIRIVDVTGKTILQKVPTGISTEIETTYLPKGVYLAEVRFSGGIQTKKIIVN
jgi:aminopeptidase N